MARFTLRVKPGSKKGPLVEAGETGELVVYVRERVVDGEANAAVVELLSKHFGVSKSRIKIVHGASARTKIIDVI